MELSKKTTLLLTPQLHATLTKLAQARGTSMGDLIRQACESQYGVYNRPDSLAAVREIAQMGLPVTDVQTMIAESTPYGPG